MYICTHYITPLHGTTQLISNRHTIKAPVLLTCEVKMLHFMYKDVVLYDAGQP
jgi:hypothetical protein